MSISKGLLLIACLLFLPLKNALALDCYFGASGGSVEKAETIMPFAVPANAKTGDKIWESDDIKIPVYCDNNTNGDFESEHVYAWVNPYPGMQDRYYQLGVTYNGADYDASLGKSRIDTNQCIDSKKIDMYTPEQIIAMGWQNKICSGDPANIRKSRTFMARMRLYVKLREMPPHDYQSTLSDYTIVQFDGAGSVNEDPSAKNLKYHIYGLENIRVLDCSVDFAITPDNQVIDFGKFNVLDIRRHNITKTFSIKTTKTQNGECTDGFKVSSSFYTEETLVEGDQALLVGNGLRLRVLDENSSPYTFNKYSEYADFTSDMLVYEKTYTAELSSISGTPIEPGPFDTVVLFKINYN
ncbi:fimbrial protein [Escherichia sp. E2593]|uniref:fimbrial protein n=1 Tax=unclassified Escherichia TaxID=2608889 RepID=UPI001029C900|nr:MULTISPECIES: fimbrial protein [unclassified Escherichia]RZN42415.1 type 1 fimbrial protein [Escherichia sp. E10V5]TLI71880.1 fimbrial protein [Escherichia sp. E1130]TLI83971.1 fimbrial protein [Escherichia sp. E2562]TLI87117.1 fimbrial protein [Escherichia sp. E2593]